MNYLISGSKDGVARFDVAAPEASWLNGQAFAAHRTLEPVTLEESQVWQGWVEH